MALSRAVSALQIAAPFVDTIPILGSSLRAVLEVAGNIVDYADGVKSNRERIEELAEHAATWCTTIVKTLSNQERGERELLCLLEQLQTMLGVLREIENWTLRRLKKPLMQRFWNKSQDGATIIKLDQRLRHAFDQFMLASQLTIQENVADLVSDADRRALDLLGSVSAACYDSLNSPSGCLPNTRNDLIDEMFNWSIQPVNAISVYWLAGLAGTGKSTIAKTFCERVASHNAAWMLTFFASKSSAERRDPFRMLYTFSYELASLNPTIRKHVVSAVQAHPDIRQRLMKDQVDELIARPLAAAYREGTARPLVMVIDALDECIKVQGVEGGTLVQDLAHALKELPVKLVVTSRPERTIRRVFDGLPEKSSRLLHDLDLSEVSEDVRRLLEFHFKAICIEHQIQSQQWPSDDVIRLLTERTGHLFIFATTVLHYVDDREVRQPETRLRHVLEQRSATRPDYPFAEIDMLYLHILRSAAQDTRGQINHIISDRLQLMLGTICLLQEPQAASDIAFLLKISKSEIERDIDALAAVLLRETDSTKHDATRAVRIFHPSFRDFLTDYTRCHDDRFWIETTLHHHDLSERCLTLLNENLRQDMCEIRDFTVHISAINNPPLASRLDQYVPESLRYACCFWSEHLISSTKCPSTSLVSALITFAYHHLLHWIELLSTLGHIAQAAKMIPSIITWCKIHDSVIQEQANMQTSIQDLFSDTLRLLLAYKIPLTTQALHVYSGMLTTIANCSLINLIVAEPQSPHLLTPRSPGWSAGQIVLEGHTALVYSAVFSPDGNHTVSGSTDMSLRVWDSHTGDQSAILEGHSGQVLSVAYSPDGTQIISGSSDKTARLWDSRTGLEHARLEGHGRGVSSVAFSSDGLRIASGSYDETIRLWDAQSTLPIITFRGHTSPVMAVVFSPNGARIVSCGYKDPIRLWDTETGLQCAQFGTPADGARSLAFSSDGARIAAGYNKVIRLWDAQTGSQTLKMSGHNGLVMSIAFSPDDSQIVSGSTDKTIRLWDAHTGSETTKLDGHGDGVFSTAFSPDGSRIISGSKDKTLRLWDTPNSGPLNPVKTPDSLYSQALINYQGHARCVRSVAFSRDGAHAVSASIDKTILLWDVKTGTPIRTFVAQGKWLSTIAFSMDGTTIIAQCWGGITLSWIVPGLPCLPMPNNLSNVWSLDKQDGARCTQETDWVMWKFSPSGETIDLCWLPVDLRGIACAVHENIVAIGTKTGRLTIIDFTGTIAALRGLGVIEGEGAIVVDRVDRNPRPIKHDDVGNNVRRLVHGG